MLTCGLHHVAKRAGRAAGTTAQRDQQTLQAAQLEARVAVNNSAGGSIAVPSSELPIAGLEVSELESMSSCLYLGSDPYSLDDTRVSGARCLVHDNSWRVSYVPSGTASQPEVLHESNSRLSAHCEPPVS